MLYEHAPHKCASCFKPFAGSIVHEGGRAVYAAGHTAGWTTVSRGTELLLACSKACMVRTLRDNFGFKLPKEAP